MAKILDIGVIGDFNPGYENHVATKTAISYSARQVGVGVKVEWLPTNEMNIQKLDRFDAILCAPGSPYRSFDGALKGIRFARENNVPFIGTCGGFQHAVIEYARNVMGIEDAEHAEEHPDARNLFVTPLTCSLVGKVEEVKIAPASHAFEIYKASSTMERFYCNYGLNPSRRGDVVAAGLSVSGVDSGGEVRIVELPKARFYFGTLFVPQAVPNPERPHPLLTGLLKAALATETKC
jgi:CTP synthase (UTP-ammonia lyase)